MQSSRFPRFSALIGSAAKNIQRLKNAYMGRYALSSAHTNCLCQLAAAQPAGLTQTELARREQMDRAQVCRVLRELDRRGFVVSVGPTSYKRHYRLTPAGAAAAEEINAIILRVQHYVSDEIPPEDLAVFYRTLEIIVRRLGAAVDRYAPHGGRAECPPG